MASFITIKIIRTRWNKRSSSSFSSYIAQVYSFFISSIDDLSSFSVAFSSTQRHATTIPRPQGRLTERPAEVMAWNIWIMGKLSNHIQHWLISEFPYYNSSKSSQVQSTSSSSIGTIECKLVKALHGPHNSSDRQPPPCHELHPSESTATGVWLHQGTIGQRHGQQPQATCLAGRRFSHGNGIEDINTISVNSSSSASTTTRSRSSNR